MDVYSKEKRSDIMSRIKGKETQLEKTGWALLKTAGVRFRKHPKNVPGNPDAGHKGKKIAVFFDSAFWHGADWHKQKRTFKSNRKFWIPKIERNISRDNEVNSILKKSNWKVLRITESDLKKANHKKTIQKIIRMWS